MTDVPADPAVRKVEKEYMVRRDGAVPVVSVASESSAVLLNDVLNHFLQVDVFLDIEK